MKKIVSVILAVLVVFSMFVFTASAATAPTITAKADKTEVKAGDTVKVTVSTSKNSKIGSATLNLVYSTEYFEYVVTETSTGAFEMESIKEKTAGSIELMGITGMTKPTIDDSVTTLFTVTFKVLKAGGEIKLVAKEVYVADDGEDVDVTSKIAGNTIKFTAVPTACAHANKETKEVAATCTTAGKKTVTCKDCGAKISEEAIAAKGHDFENPVVKKEATCTEKGLKEGKCKRCSEVTKEEIPATGHTAGAATVTTQPTCTEAGVSTTKCTKCSAVIKTAQVEKLGHKFGDKAVTKEATCTEKGLKEGKCERCNATVKEEIPTVAHKYGEYKVVTPATATKDGLKQRVCSVCGNVNKAVIQKTGTGNAGTSKPGDLNDPNTGVSLTFAFAAAGLALATGTVVRRKRK